MRKGCPFLIPRWSACQHAALQAACQHFSFRVLAEVLTSEGEA
jgi:hypothetical protein